MNKKLHLKSVVYSIIEEKGLAFEQVYNLLSTAIIKVFKIKFKTLFFKIEVNNDNFLYDIFAIYLLKRNARYDLSFKEAFNFAFLNGNYILYKNFLLKKISVSNFKRKELYEAKKLISFFFKKVEKKNIISDLSFFLNKTLNGIIIKTSESYFLIFIEKNIYGILFKTECIPNEYLYINMRLKVYVRKILSQDRESLLYLSRSCSNLVVDLLKLEIPEICNNSIFVKSIIRKPGLCSKVVVYSNLFFNAISVCLGYNGLRIRNVSKYLNFERIDLILWDHDLKKFILNMFPKFSIKKIELNYRKKIAILFVDEKFISFMVGKNGINLNLLSNLLSWEIKVLNLI